METDIEFVLSHCYPNINTLLGELIRQRITIPKYESEKLTSRLLRVTQKLPSSPVYQHILEMIQFTDQSYEHNDNEDDFNDDFDDDYNDDFSEYDLGDYLSQSEYEKELFKLDSGLSILDQTISRGAHYCKGFDHISKNIKLLNPQQADKKIQEILIKIKAFEFLSRRGFRDITKLDPLNNEYIVDFVVRKKLEYYAIVTTNLYSQKNIEENMHEYDENFIKRSLSNDFSYAIDSKYPELADFCSTHVGIKKGILFISSNRDYFGDRRYEKSVCGITAPKLIGILNNHWVKRKEGRETYKYLNNIVVTTGRNVWDAIIYPSLN